MEPTISFISLPERFRSETIVFTMGSVSINSLGKWLSLVIRIFLNPDWLSICRNVSFFSAPMKHMNALWRRKTFTTGAGKSFVSTMSLIDKCPPLFSKRYASSNTFCLLTARLITQLEIIRSTVLLGNGMLSMFYNINSTLW